ncbi:unnamed protein product [Effrenium voratum]|uniref:Uncharacterized protein n=1 Tax=Effrenium voratum TaxID=2562239 RepID=A0AA36ITI9_9DINO|nr:unnamed protein product [Effrenium voratum]
MADPALRLFHALLVTMLAILAGFICVRLEFVRPEKGELKGLAFFIGAISFPLLIFNTVATAEIAALDVAVIGACSLGKVVVMALTWCLSFVAYQPKRCRGQRVLTASVFAFFAVASDDFAIGFPVIEALYGEQMDMSIYITGNALVGSLFFVPLTMIAFAIGGALKHKETGPEVSESVEEGADGSSEMTCLRLMRSTCYDLGTNPVLVMTCAGLAFNLIFGSKLVESDGHLKLPSPFSNFVELFTAPFGMCALLLTGASLRSPQVSVWALGLVLMKVVVCAYLSYAFGSWLSAGKEDAELKADFTFFYGALPTGSPPLVFAAAFDPASCELVATAVLFGLILSGPIMFVTAYSLSSRSLEAATRLLQEIQGSADAVSLFCGVGLLACVALALFARPTWVARSAATAQLAVYGLVLTAYAAVSLAVNPLVAPETCRAYNQGEATARMFAFAWLQNSASTLLLSLECLLVCSGTGFLGRRLRARWGLALAAVCGVAALAPAIWATPNTVNEICGREEVVGEGLLLNVAWSCLQLLLALVLALGGLARHRAALRARRALEALGGAANEAGEVILEKPQNLVPRGACLAVTLLNVVKLLTQVVNAGQVSMGNRNRGSFAAMLLLEASLEHGQLVVLLAALMFDASFASSIREALGAMWSSWTAQGGRIRSWTFLLTRPKAIQETNV